MELKDVNFLYTCKNEINTYAGQKVLEQCVS